MVEGDHNRAAAGCSLLCIQGMEQASPDPTMWLSSTTFITYPKQRRTFLAERIKLWDIFRFNKLSGGVGRSGFFSCVFSNVKITEHFMYYYFFLGMS